MADEDREFQEDEGGEGSAEGVAADTEGAISASGSEAGSIQDSSFSGDSPEADPPIIVQGGGSTST